MPKVGAELVRSEPRSQESSASRRNARLPPLAPTPSQGDRRRPSLTSNPLPQAACDPAVPAPDWISGDPAISPRIFLQVLWPWSLGRPAHHGRFQEGGLRAKAGGAASRLSGPVPFPRLWLNPGPLSPGTARSGPGIQLDRATPGLHISLDGGAQGRAEQQEKKGGGVSVLWIRSIPLQVFPDPGDPDCEPDTPERGGPIHQGPLCLCRCSGSDAAPSDALPETGPGPGILPAAGHHPLLSVVSMPLAALCPHPRLLPLSVSQPRNLDPFTGFPGATLLSRHTCPCPLAPV